MARSTIDRTTRRIGGTVAEPLQDTLFQISSPWLLCTLADAYSDVVTATGATAARAESGTKQPKIDF